MAIAYKSAGAGKEAATGVNLNPNCPATVDAGDILLAHVYCRPIATTNGPTNPGGGWEQLFNAEFRDTAEHWIFGKIADGTEDGAAISFGSPAIATRAARIYSYSGRVSGTITECVKDFATTDTPASGNWTVPSVTTTQAGALAVAFIAITDDNVVATPTGESGGDWTEPVSEYSSAALQTDFSLGMFRAIPTGDPGTISGGTGTTGNDFCGLVGFQIVPDGAAPTEQTIALEKVSETDTANAFSSKKFRGFEMVSETDLARAFVAVKNQTIATSIEIETSMSFTHNFVKTLDTAIENNTAEIFIPKKSNLMGQAIETELAQAFGSAKVAVFTLVTELETAQNLSLKKIIIVQTTNETDLASDFTVPLVKPLGRVSEINLVRTISRIITTGNPVYYPHQIIRSIESDLYFASLPSDTIIMSIASDGVIE